MPARTHVDETTHTPLPVSRGVRGAGRLWAVREGPPGRGTPRLDPTKMARMAAQPRAKYGCEKNLIVSENTFHIHTHMIM